MQDDLIAVTQADREAAADYLQSNGDAFTAHMRDGTEDDTAVVQAFARHRRQAEAAMRERCAAIAEDYADHYLGGAPDGLAVAIRAGGSA